MRANGLSVSLNARHLRDTESVLLTGAFLHKEIRFCPAVVLQGELSIAIRPSSEFQFPIRVFNYDKLSMFSSVGYTQTIANGSVVAFQCLTEGDPLTTDRRNDGQQAYRKSNNRSTNLIRGNLLNPIKEIIGDRYEAKLRQ